MYEGRNKNASIYEIIMKVGRSLLSLKNKIFFNRETREHFWKRQEIMKFFEIASFDIILATSNFLSVSFIPENLVKKLFEKTLILENSTCSYFVKLIRIWNLKYKFELLKILIKKKLY